MHNTIYKFNAYNKCLSCNHEWKGIYGPGTICPECGHIYVKWLNYEDIDWINQKIINIEGVHYA